MPKCRHQKVTIIENGDWFTSHDRDDNGEWSHWQYNGDTADSELWVCPECGKETSNVIKDEDDQ